VIVVVRPVSTLRFGTCAAASSSSAVTTLGQTPNTTDVNLLLLAAPTHVSVYPVCSTVPLYTVEEPDPPGACPQTCRPDIALVRAARLPGPTRRALSGMLAIARNNVRTRVIESLVHTPLVTDKVRFTRLFYVNFGAYAPYHSSKVINQPTVPTAGMSACKSFYRKKLVGR
jgi:hypothetical protein